MREKQREGSGQDNEADMEREGEGQATSTGEPSPSPSAIYQDNGQAEKPRLWPSEQTARHHGFSSLSGRQEKYALRCSTNHSTGMPLSKC